MSPSPADKTISSPAATTEPQKTTAKLPGGTDVPGAIVNPAKPGEDDKEPAPPATSTTEAAAAPKPTEPTEPKEPKEPAKPTEKKPEPTSTPQTNAPTTLQTSVLPTTTSPPPQDPVSSIINTALPETTSLLAAPSSSGAVTPPPTNGLAQAQNGGAPPQSGGFPMGATIGIAVAGGVGALALVVTSIVLLRRHWRRRREGDNEQLKQLDNMYEQGKPTGFESMPREKERWQRGLEQYHSGGGTDNFTTAGTTTNAYRL